MEQWIRTCLPVQRTRVQSLAQKDSTCLGATKPTSHKYRVCLLQLLRAVCLEPVLRNKSSHRREKPAHRIKGWPPLAATTESPSTAAKTQCSEKETDFFFF